MRRLAASGAGFLLLWWLVGQWPGMLGALGGARMPGPPVLAAQALFYRTGRLLIAPAGGRLAPLVPEGEDLPAGAPVARIVRPGSPALLTQAVDAAASLSKLPDPGPRLARLDSQLAAGANRLAAGLREGEAEAASLPDLRPLLRERQELEAQEAERQRLQELASIKDLAALTVEMPESGAVSWLLPPGGTTPVAVRAAARQALPSTLAAGELLAVIASPGSGAWAVLLPAGSLQPGERVSVDGVPARVAAEAASVTTIITDSLGRASPARWSRVTISRLSQPAALPLWHGGVVTLTGARPHLRWLPPAHLPEGVPVITRPWLVRPWIR